MGRLQRGLLASSNIKPDPTASRGLLPSSETGSALGCLGVSRHGWSCSRAWGRSEEDTSFLLRTVQVGHRGKWRAARLPEGGVGVCEEKPQGRGGMRTPDVAPSGTCQSRWVAEVEVCTGKDGNEMAGSSHLLGQCSSREPRPGS